MTQENNGWSWPRVIGGFGGGLAAGHISQPLAQEIKSLTEEVIEHASRAKNKREFFRRFIKAYVPVLRNSAIMALATAGGVSVGSSIADMIFGDGNSNNDMDKESEWNHTVQSETKDNVLGHGRIKRTLEAPREVGTKMGSNDWKSKVQAAMKETGVEEAKGRGKAVKMRKALEKADPLHKSKEEEKNARESLKSAGISRIGKYLSKNVDIERLGKALEGAYQKGLSKAKKVTKKTVEKATKSGSDISGHIDILHIGNMAFVRGLQDVISKEAKELTYQARKKLPQGEFVYPKERRYPIHDLPHARNALARVGAHGTTEEKSKVQRAVFAKYPELKKSRMEREGGGG